MQLIFSPILGGLSDKYGRRPVLFLSIIGTGIGFVMIGLANSLWMLFAGRILDGITGGNISTAQAYIADITTTENRAKGMGLIGAAFGLGFIRSEEHTSELQSQSNLVCRLLLEKKKKKNTKKNNIIYKKK